MVFGHDRLLEFGAGFDRRGEGLVEVVEPVFDLGPHRDGLLDVGDLRLEDREAVVDDRSSFELLALPACGVFGQRGVVRSRTKVRPLRVRKVSAPTEPERD